MVNILNSNGSSNEIILNGKVVAVLHNDGTTTILDRSVASVNGIECTITLEDGTQHVYINNANNEYIVDIDNVNLADLTW